MSQKSVAVILAGNGVYDGAEIHEATLSLLAIAEAGATYEIFAPNINQHHVINHITGEEMPESRNVLIESARIARGNIKDINEYDAKQFDALLFPGGFGVAKNLSDFAFNGDKMTVIDSVKEAILGTIGQAKPIGALCISPVLFANILDDANLTIGQDEGTAQAIEAMGAKHEPTNHGEVIVDKNYKLATTPCYMLDANIIDIASGARNVVNAVLDMA
jgi:enhancing lycopene biosynthesis protein 2